MNKRAIVIIIDGVGVGELPDAGKYGDIGSDTLGNLSRETGGLNLPNLEKLGLGCIHPIAGIKCVENPLASYGKMAEASPGKDSTTGHWELGGLVLDKPFPTYPNGFPDEILALFTRETGLNVLGNYALSTELSGLVNSSSLVMEGRGADAVIEVIGSLPGGIIPIIVFSVMSLIFMATSFD